MCQFVLLLLLHEVVPIELLYFINNSIGRFTVPRQSNSHWYTGIYNYVLIRACIAGIFSTQQAMKNNSYRDYYNANNATILRKRRLLRNIIITENLHIFLTYSATCMKIFNKVSRSTFMSNIL